jgi:hypothetical protein
MLKRVNADKFEAQTGTTIRLVFRSRNNNGVNQAKFEYDHTILSNEVISGMPGCSFKVRAGTVRFEAVVAFDPGSPTARYDVFEVDGVGGLTNLNEEVLASDPLPRITFKVEGVAAAESPVPSPLLSAAASGGSEDAAPTKKAAKPAKRKTSRTKKVR